jgi:hypothetical protein
MSQNIDWSSTGNYYNNCPIQNYPKFSVFYLQKLEINLKKFSIRSPDSLLLEVGWVSEVCKWPKGGDFWQINTDLRRYTEETWANFWTNWRLGTSSSLAVSRVVFTRNIEIFGQEINTYKPFYNYINIDVYLYVKSSHYVLIKTRVGVFYQIYNARRSRAFYVW